MSGEHVALVRANLADWLLSGRKRIESRFSRYRRPPLGHVLPGDLIHFKISGGGLVGTAHVIAIREFDGLNSLTLARIRRRYNDLICAPPAYWRQRHACRYGILIWIGPCRRPPPFLHVPRQFGSGWLVLPPISRRKMASRRGLATASSLV